MAFVFIVVIGAIIGCLLLFLEWEDVCDGIMGMLLGMLIGIFVSVFIAVIMYGCVLDNAEIISIPVQETEISALADNMANEGRISGNVFIASGYVSENLKYGYMYKVEGKGYCYGSVPADQSYINKTAETPKVIHYDIDYKNKILEWFFPYPGVDEYVFYLPETAEITTEYIIDLK